MKKKLDAQIAAELITLAFADDRNSFCCGMIDVGGFSVYSPDDALDEFLDKVEAKRLTADEVSFLIASAAQAMLEELQSRHRPKSRGGNVLATCTVVHEPHKQVNRSGLPCEDWLIEQVIKKAGFSCVNTWVNTNSGNTLKLYTRTL